MSSRELFREPSWSGLRPALPDYAAVDPSETERLRRLTQLDGEVLQLTLGGRRVDMFKFEPAGQPPALVKLVPPGRRLSASRAEAIAAWLYAAGAPVVAALPGFPIWQAAGDGVVALPFIDGRPVQPTEQDMALLGHALAQMQQGLSRHPERAQWVTSTDERLSGLMAMRSSLATGAFACGPDPTRLSELAGDGALDFVLASAERIPLHGDLNPGNALLIGDRAILLDLEDVFHSVLAPIFELALVVERFVLVSVDDEARAVAAGRAFLRSWTSDKGGSMTLGSVDPVTIFRSLALRSLCVLASAERQGLSMPVPEWEKFFLLEQLATRRADTIAAIFKELAV